MATNGGAVQVNKVVRYESGNSDSVQVEEGGVQTKHAAGNTDCAQVEVHSPAKNRTGARSDGRGSRGSRGSQRRSMLLFERASGSWWNPKFDSRVLEKALLHHYFPHTRRRFQYALLYVLLAGLGWVLFFSGARPSSHWWVFMVGALAMAAVTALVLVFTRRPAYERHVLPTSLTLSLLLCGLLLATFAVEKPDVSLVGTFGACLEVVLLMYTFIPMPLFVCVPLGLLLSLTYEGLVVWSHSRMGDASLVVGKVLMILFIFCSCFVLFCFV